MTHKPRPHWTVPIMLGDLTCNATIEVDERGNVKLWTPSSEVGPDALTPLEAAQLSLALQDASRVAAEMRVKIEGRRKR